MWYFLSYLIKERQKPLDKDIETQAQIERQIDIKQTEWRNTIQSGTDSNSCKQTGRQMTKGSEKEVEKFNLGWFLVKL